MNKAIFFLMLALSAAAQPTDDRRKVFFESPAVSSTAVVYPTNVPNLVLWVQADVKAYKDLGSTLAGNGDAVEQWNDSSSAANNLIQTTAVNRPFKTNNVLNGLPIIAFPGNAQPAIIAPGDVTWNTPSTMWMVYRWRSQSALGSGSPGNIFSWNNGLGGFKGKVKYGGDPTTTADLNITNATSAANFWNPCAQSFNGTVWYNVNVIMDTGGHMRTNGVDVGSTFNLNGDMRQILIGSAQNADLAGQFDLAEFIWVNAHASDANIQGVEKYLKQKWGL